MTWSEAGRTKAFETCNVDIGSERWRFWKNRGKSLKVDLCLSNFVQCSTSTGMFVETDGLIMGREEKLE